MHNTVAVLKSGKKLEGVLWTFRPEDGYFTLIHGNKESRVRFASCVSVLTEGERLTTRTIGTMDELQRARDYMKKARENRWLKKLVPVQAWEKGSVK